VDKSLLYGSRHFEVLPARAFEASADQADARNANSRMAFGVTDRRAR
jgi:hypothetical protein